ncbi:hypothetical protein BJ944DRAFT_233643 [Cunninghamella echinulata]|nr:hypothetical protein BJ944DRAFT_233643 [Cunninghamella echinulata]
MWKLSSGKFVEREMRKLAALTNFKDCKTPKDFYIAAYQSKFDPIEAIDEKWTQESTINFVNVINQNIFSTDLSEADILNKLWNFVYTAFYKRCAEVGKNVTVRFDDKYLNDDLKKVPSILKDMLSVFLNHDNKIKSDVYSIGLVTMVYKAKTMMERSVQVLNYPNEKPVCIVSIKKPSILPSFIPAKRKYEKKNEKNNSMNTLSIVIILLKFFIQAVMDFDGDDKDKKAYD